MNRYRLALIVAVSVFVLCLAAMQVQAAGTNYIKGMVYNDTDKDGMWDATEVGVPGLTVDLTTAAGDPVASLATNHNGWFNFTNLADGQYIVYVDLPPGYAFSSAPNIAVTLDGAYGHACFYVYVVQRPPFAPRTIGYWKNHEDAIKPLLPITLGNTKITTVDQAVYILSQKEGPSNGIVKLRAQLLAARLDIAAGADGSAIWGRISEADALLAAYDTASWGSLSKAQQQYVLSLKDVFDAFNNSGE